MSILSLLSKLALKTGKVVTKDTANKLAKTAKSFSKKNPGISQVGILRNLEAKYNIPLLRDKLNRGVIIPASRHDADDLMKNIFTKNQLKKIDREAISASKTQQWKEGILGTEEHIDKLSQAQIGLIDKSIKTGIPSKNPVVEKIVNLRNMGFSKEGTNTYTKAQQKFASDYGGRLNDLRGKPDFQQAWHTARTEAQAVYYNLMGKPTQAKKILDKYGKDPGWEDIVKARQDWTDVITPGRTAYKLDKGKLSDEFIKQGVTGLGKFSAQNPYLAGIAHQLGIAKTMQLFKNLTPRNMKTKEMIQMINDPANIGIEYNFMNPSMGSLQGVFSTLNPGQLNKLGRLPKMLEDAQVGLKYFDDEGILRSIGKKGRELDPEQMRRYMQYIAKELPFGVTKSGRPRYLPIKSKKYVEDLMQGTSQYNFATGGLASMIGKKALKKIAKKLSEKDLKLLMGSFFKDTKPLMSPKNLREARIKKYLAGKGATKKWQYVKSEIPGPKSSLERAQERAFYENTIVYPQASNVAKFPSKGLWDDIDRSGRLADRKWEKEMLKKLKLDENTELKYPFLNPDNNAFIVTRPREGLGRYQMRGYLSDQEKDMIEAIKKDYPPVLEPHHFKDFRKKMEEIGPISKYAVYDWWDDVLQQMRKKPKFKYVKDDKGNVIMKKVK